MSTTVNISKIINSNTALTPTAGEKVFKELNQHLQAEETTDLDFSEISAVTTAFLNACIGQLYAFYDSAYLNQHLNIVNLDPDNNLLLKRVIVRAKEYFTKKD